MDTVTVANDYNRVHTDHTDKAISNPRPFQGLQRTQLQLS